MISNIDLSKISDQLKVKYTVICKDELKDQYPTGAYIINLNNSNESGSHWVCLVICKTVGFYCDSFAGEAPNEVYTFCRKNKLKLAINTYIIQHLESTNCGYFCVGLIYYLNLNKGFENAVKFINECNNFINLFDDDAKLNDVILYNYLTKTIKPKRFTKTVLSYFDFKKEATKNDS